MAIIDARATEFTFGTTGKDLLEAVYLRGDSIDGMTGNDTIFGLDGGDLLIGGTGNDRLSGLGGNDILDGGAGNDVLLGGIGNDTFRPDTGSVGNDLVDGGDGIDVIDYSNSAAVIGVRIDLSAVGAQKTRGAGSDVILNVENAFGTAFDDSITGSQVANQLQAGFGNDTLDGAAGNDFLNGASGADVINGGDGHDDIRGGEGADILTGGAGADLFNFRILSESSAGSVDRITDFNSAEGDSILLLPLSFVVNVNSTRFIGAAEFTVSGVSEIRVTTDGAVQTVQVDKNGDGDIDMVLEVVGTPLSFYDFLF